MRFGICCDIVEAIIAEQSGADFFEPAVTVALEPQTDGTPESLKGLSRVSIGPEAFNVFLPADLKVTGPAVDMDALADYAGRAFARAAAVGASVIGFGSGASRSAPEGFDRGRALEQFEEFLRAAAALAARENVVLALEPLSSRECNMINTVADALSFVERLADPCVRVLANGYHMHLEGEDPAVLSRAGGLVAHVHVAEPAERMAPRRGGHDWRPFFGALKSGGYDARVSIECVWTDFPAEAPEALTVVKEAWAAA